MVRKLIPKGQVKREFTPQEEIFAAGLLMGKSKAQAARDAGYSEKRARTTGSEKTRDENFREKLKEYAYKRGLSADYAIDKLKGLIEQDTVLLMGRDKSTPLTIPDGATRAKGMDMFLKVMGAYPDPKMDINANMVATVVVRSTDELGLDPFSADIIDGEVVEQETKLID